MHKDGWTQLELDHIARHSVTAAEVEEALTPPLRVVTIDVDAQGTDAIPIAELEELISRHRAAS